MDFIIIIIWIFATLNVGIGVVLSFYFQRLVKNQKFLHEKAKNIYSLIYGIGVFIFTTGLFFLFVKTFHIPLGHGESLVAFPIFNFILTCLFIFLGRMLIEWKPIKF